MEVSMVTKVGDRDVIRTMPFVQIKMALAASHKTTAQLSRLRPAGDLRRGRRRAVRVEHDRPDLRRQGRKRHEPEDGRFPARPGDLRREERAVHRRSRTGRARDRHDPERRRRPGGGAPLHRTRALRRYARHPDAQRLLWRPHRPGERLGHAAHHGRRTGDRSSPRKSSPSTPTREIAKAFADSGYEGEDATGMAEAIVETARDQAAEGRHRAARRAGSARRRGQGRPHQRLRPTSAICCRSRSTIDGQFVPAAEPETNPELLTAFDDAPRRRCAAICRPSMTASTAPPIPTACRRT